MAISETKMQMVIANYFKNECDVNTSIKQAFEKGFRIGVKKGASTKRPHGEWIPCSERLPSESGRYLVVYPMLINKPWVSILWYGKPTFPEKDEPCFYASDDEYGDVEYSDVIAWMPLPEPYGEREGE